MKLFGKKSKDSSEANGTAPAAASSKVSNPPAAAPSTAAKGAAELSPDETKRRQALSRRISLAFGEIVSVLMRSKTHRQLSLAAIEQIVVPAVLTGQYSLAQASSKANGFTAPVGVVLWASVSDEVDKRLTDAADQPVRLSPNDWKSGDKLWLVEAVGDGRVVNALVKQLQTTVWKDRPVKMRTRGEDAKISTKELPR